MRINWAWKSFMIVNWNCTLPENEGTRIKVDIVWVCKKKNAMALVMSINFSNTCFLQVSCKSVLSFAFTTCHHLSSEYAWTVNRFYRDYFFKEHSTKDEWYLASTQLCNIFCSRGRSPSTEKMNADDVYNETEWTSKQLWIQTDILERDFSGRAQLKMQLQCEKCRISCVKLNIYNICGLLKLT